jgi:hypothetical protein
MGFPTKIEGLSDQRRFVPKGKIRLGVKVKNAKGVEYPKETEYFACHEVPEVEAVYGAKPTALDVMFPTGKLDVIFPQAYECYGRNTGLKCTGNGSTGVRFGEDGDQTDVTCPTPDNCDFAKVNGCSAKGHLKFFLPKVGIGLYQIDVGSINSIIDINSGLEWAKLLAGDIAMKHFILRRSPKETHKDGKKAVHYTLKIELNEEKLQVNPFENIALPEPGKQESGQITNIDLNVIEIQALAKEVGLDSWGKMLTWAYDNEILDPATTITPANFKIQLTADRDLNDRVTAALKTAILRVKE